MQIRRLSKITFVFMVAMVLVITAVMFCGCQSKDGDRLRENTVKVECMYGPTSVGLADLIQDQSKSLNPTFSFKQVTLPENIVADLESGQVDIATLPLNVAVNLYNKSDSLIQMLDINTLCPVCAVSPNPYITDLNNVGGYSLYVPGQMSVPTGVVRVLLAKAGIDSSRCRFEYINTTDDMIKLLDINPSAVAFPFEPQATVGLDKNQNIKRLFNLTDEWDKYVGGKIVSGVTVVRTDFANENPEAVKEFMKAHKSSIDAVNDDTSIAKNILSDQGIVIENTDEAVHNCNIDYYDGKEAKSLVMDFLKIFNEYVPDLLPNGLPNDKFFYSAM